MEILPEQVKMLHSHERQRVLNNPDINKSSGSNPKSRLFKQTVSWGFKSRDPAVQMEP